MAVLSGILAVGSDSGFQNTKLSLGLRAFAFDYWPPYTTIETEPTLKGSVSSQLPVSTTARSLSGILPTTFFSDFYNRIHFNPLKLELGNIQAGLVKTIDVWNAYLTTISMSSFVAPADTGIVVTAPVTAPYTIKPIQLLEYRLTFTENTAASISDTVGWIIGGVGYGIPITANRTVVFPFKPTWDGSMDETLEWRTAIERAWSGAEQRSSLRATPRRILEFSVRLTSYNAQLYDNLLFGWAGRLYALPIWMDKTKLTAQAAAGATTLALDTSNKSFHVDGQLVLWKDESTTEACDIATVGASSVTLKRPLLATWAAGTVVYPTMLSRLEASTGVNRLTDATLESTLRFESYPTGLNPRIPSVAASTTYKGVELYVDKPNWGDGVSFALEADYEVIDSLTGVYAIARKADTPIVQKTQSWFLKTKTQITDFRAWLGRRAGQAKPVWMPSGTIDFVLLDAVTNAATTIVVKENGFSTLAINRPDRKHILVQLRNGNNYAREITSLTDLGNDRIQLSIDSAFGVAFTPADVKRISFLGLWRLASDAVTLAYQTDSVATAQTTMRLTKP